MLYNTFTVIMLFFPQSFDLEAFFNVFLNTLVYLQHGYKAENLKKKWRKTWKKKEILVTLRFKPSVFGSIGGGVTDCIRPQAYRYIGAGLNLMIPRIFFDFFFRLKWSPVKKKSLFFFTERHRLQNQKLQVPTGRG